MPVITIQSSVFGIQKVYVIRYNHLNFFRSFLSRVFMTKKQRYLPKPQGLYHPKNEKENCGVGFIANIKSKASYKITEDALEMLSRMGHRGACGCEANTCLLYTSPSPRDRTRSRMPSSA